MNPTFTQQTVVKESELDAGQLGSLIAAKAKEGILLDDLYAIDIYFFFDKEDRLVKYNFLKVYRGM